MDPSERSKAHVDMLASRRRFRRSRSVAARALTNFITRRGLLVLGTALAGCINGKQAPKPEPPGEGRPAPIQSSAAGPATAPAAADGALIAEPGYEKYEHLLRDLPRDDWAIAKENEIRTKGFPGYALIDMRCVKGLCRVDLRGGGPNDAGDMSRDIASSGFFGVSAAHATATGMRVYGAAPGRTFPAADGSSSAPVSTRRDRHSEPKKFPQGP
jgi:hypothetical protein